MSRSRLWARVSAWVGAPNPPEALAPDVPPKPQPRGFGRPAAWMLAPEFLVGVPQLLLYTPGTDGVDQRDWMRANRVRIDDPGTEELWFDYLADLGDGQRAMYSLAYLCQDELWADAAIDGLDGQSTAYPGLRVPSGRTDAISPAAVLPRGAFLFLGGDSAYPIADAQTLRRNVQHPFTWAFRDLHARGRIPDRRFRLFGIPGNHDYYDQLTGFAALVRRPPGAATAAPGGRPRSIPLLGFDLSQEASYVALDLPWGWQLWGLDVNRHWLDARQAEYFRAAPPDKLIVATPEPHTVAGVLAAPDSFHAAVFRALGLSCGFLTDGRLGAERCRLDLSGDRHTYARYWGDADHPEYASVVSGLGGAFHHPADVKLGDAPEERRYPSTGASRQAIAARLLSTLTIARGGFIRVFGFFVAVLFVAASLRPESAGGIFARIAGALGAARESTIGVEGVRPAIPTAPVASGLLVAAAFVAALAAAVFLIRFALRTGAWLTRRLHEDGARRPLLARLARLFPSAWFFGDQGYAFVWMIVYLAIGLPFIAGRLLEHAPGGALLFDGVVVATFALLAIGFPAFALSEAEDLGRGARAVLLLTGAYHALLQIATPLVLARVALGDPVALAVQLLVAQLFGVAGRAVAASAKLSDRTRATLLVSLFVSYGALTLATPFLICRGTIAPSGTWARWAFYGVAGLFGALLSCRWFGWFLAVAWSLGAHAGAVGAAARIEELKQFIRFRLTPESLTGYVIAIDQPESDGAKLAPRLVDVFTVRPRRTTCD